MPDFPEQVHRLIDMAIEEDLGHGDITSEATLDQESRGEASIIARQALVCSGLEVVPIIFEKVGRGVSYRFLAFDGQKVESGTVLAELHGPMRVLMAGERTALNFLQRMSGIATLSREYADRAAGRVVILDSRKTVPGWRWLDKMAVRAGGCTNHRMGLYDGILIKDNHIAACGGIEEAVRRARENKPENLDIEVEVGELLEIEEAIKSGADIIMLDNFTPKEVAEAIELNAGRARLEVSGRINLGNMESFLDAGGFDFLSVGELTHSARAADIALDVRETGTL
jgi:nicotinate-nucleotide pyrophosphorylase (carboxylating)